MDTKQKRRSTVTWQEQSPERRRTPRLMRLSELSVTPRVVGSTSPPPYATLKSPRSEVCSTPPPKR
eukprot:2415016-Pleurochrysis_carterae.AAC.1